MVTNKVNGSTIGFYLDWVKKTWAPGRGTFECLEIHEPADKRRVGDSQMCHDFVNASLWWMYQEGGVSFKPERPIFRDHIVLFARGGLEDVVHHEHATEDSKGKDSKKGLSSGADGELEAAQGPGWLAAWRSRRKVQRFFGFAGVSLGRHIASFANLRGLIAAAKVAQVDTYVYHRERYKRVVLESPFINYCYLPLKIPPAEADIFGKVKRCALPLEFNASNNNVTLNSMERLLGFEAWADENLEACAAAAFLVALHLCVLALFRHCRTRISAKQEQPGGA